MQASMFYLNKSFIPSLRKCCLAEYSSGTPPSPVTFPLKISRAALKTFIQSLGLAYLIKSKYSSQDTNFPMPTVVLPRATTIPLAS